MNNKFSVLVVDVGMWKNVAFMTKQIIMRQDQVNDLDETFFH